LSPDGALGSSVPRRVGEEQVEFCIANGTSGGISMLIGFEFRRIKSSPQSVRTSLKTLRPAVSRPSVISARLSRDRLSPVFETA